MTWSPLVIVSFTSCCLCSSVKVNKRTRRLSCLCEPTVALGWEPHLRYPRKTYSFKQVGKAE